MGPVTHFLTAWTIANTAQLTRRDRSIVTLAGIAPDLDGFGMLVDVCTKHTDSPTHWFSDYHHVLGHNLGFGLLCFAAAFALAKRKLMCLSLAVVSFMTHLAADVLGGRGPDGYQWPISVLEPFSDTCVLTWSGQWELNAWPNFVITGVLLCLTFFLAWRRSFSPISIVSTRADSAFVAALRRRFGEPKPNGPGQTRAKDS